MFRRKIEIEIPRAKTEILEKINKLLRHSDYANGFVYDQKDYDFILVKPSFPIEDSFKPVFCGKIIEEANNSRIIFTVRMTSFVETILIVLVAISLLSFLPRLVSMDFTYFQFTSFPVLSLLFVLMGIGIFNLLINPQLKMLKKKLSY